MSNNISNSSQILAKLRRCNNGEGSSGQNHLGGNIDVVEEAGDIIISSDDERLNEEPAYIDISSDEEPHLPLPHVPPPSKPKTRSDTLNYLLGRELWDETSEKALLGFLRGFCSTNNVRTLPGLLMAVSNASHHLTLLSRTQFPSEIQVRAKIAKLRAVFFQFYNFVVYDELPLNSETDHITTTVAYKPYIGEETMIQTHFRKKGFAGFFDAHVFFIQSDAAFFPEEHAYYYAGNDDVFHEIDVRTWVKWRDERLFRLLAEYSKKNDVTTVNGVLNAIHTAAKEMLGLTADRIRRRIRCRRMIFMQLWNFVYEHDREINWDHGRIILEDDDFDKPYEIFHNLKVVSEYGFPGYRDMHHFFIVGKAALLPEELAVNYAKVKPQHCPLVTS